MLIEAIVVSDNDTGLVVFSIEDLVAFTEGDQKNVIRIRLIGNVWYDIIADFMSLTRHKMFGTHSDYTNVLIGFDHKGIESAVMIDPSSYEEDELDVKTLYAQFQNETDGVLSKLQDKVGI